MGFIPGENLLYSVMRNKNSLKSNFFKANTNKYECEHQNTSEMAIHIYFYQAIKRTSSVYMY